MFFASNLVHIFAFDSSTRVPNFILIKLCISELEQFLCLCEKKKKKRRTKTESLLTCNSEMAGVIFFVFEM